MHKELTQLNKKIKNPNPFFLIGKRLNTQVL